MKVDRLHCSEETIGIGYGEITLTISLAEQAWIAISFFVDFDWEESRRKSICDRFEKLKLFIWWRNIID